MESRVGTQAPPTKLFLVPTRSVVSNFNLVKPMITLDFFKPLIDSTFTAQLDGDLSFPLTLFEATAMPITDYPGRTSDPFQLKFKGEDSILLHQMIHKLKHDVLGDLEIFLVPVAQENGHYIYQAVYN